MSCACMHACLCEQGSLHVFVLACMCLHHHAIRKESTDVGSGLWMPLTPPPTRARTHVRHCTRRYGMDRQSAMDFGRVAARESFVHGIPLPCAYSVGECVLTFKYYTHVRVLETALRKVLCLTARVDVAEDGVPGPGAYDQPSSLDPSKGTSLGFGCVRLRTNPEHTHEQTHACTHGIGCLHLDRVSSSP